MVRTVFNLKGYIMLLMILLQSQQSIAALLPMNCDDMKNEQIISQENNTHMASHVHENNPSSQEQMSSHVHENNPSSQEQMSSHEKCDACNSGDCQCSTKGLCFSSSYTLVPQTLIERHILFVDLGNKFISSDEFPISGIALHPFRPPILS